MADKLVQKVTNKTTGTPITSAMVFARPVTAAGTEADISMPETPAKSGIYATASQVDHETYKIIVNGTDSQDERTVEPGRAKVRGTGGNLVYPLIDRLLDAKLFLKGLISDSKASADATDLRSAILAATHNASVKRTLVLDQDASLDLATAVSQDLHLDLNSMTLTLNADLTSGSSIITIYNGKINVNASVTILGTSTSFVNCEFIGTGVGQFMRSAAQSFTGCSGLTEHFGTNVDGVSTPAIAGGSHAFGHSAKLKLTTKGSKSGSGRLTALQDWIDQTLSDGVRMNILTWLFGNKDALAEWVAIPPASRDIIATASASFDGNAKWYNVQPIMMYDAVTNGFINWSSHANATAIRRAGITPGCKVTVSSAGAIMSARLVGLATASFNGQVTFLVGQDNSDLDDLLTFMHWLNIDIPLSKRISIKARRIGFSGGNATLYPLRITGSGEVVNLEKYLKAVASSNYNMLKINGVVADGANTVLSGDWIVFDVVVNFTEAGAYEPVLMGA